ncbi:alcohol oxidase [Marasmius fiardii PR-910]|nr:alcohol oxidase [Marasmius fiardii PR-910]
MWLSTTALALVLASIQLNTCYATPRGLERRFAVDGTVADSYDYVIVGGGQSGLALASRLTENSGVNVLVIEAGDNGDALRSRIDTPSSTYLNSITGTANDWNYMTLTSNFTNNRPFWWPRGKVLGGTSAMNAMYMVRPSQLEVDAWGQLAGDGNTWGWNSLLAGMKKSESFSPPSDDVRNISKILFDASSHGTSGPIHTSYIPFAFQQNGQFLDAMSNIGIWNNPDAMSGKNWGAWTTGTFINPSNWTRSYSRTGYIDSLPQRANLNIITNSTVTKVLFRSDSDSTATGVEYARGRDAARQTVRANREVILSSGAIGTPHLLLVSGVGPKDVLSAAGVKVQVDLPGVGEHLQDHITNSVAWNTTADTAGSLYKSGLRSTEFLATVNTGVAYLNATYLFGDAATFQKQVADQYTGSLSTALTSQDSTIVEGYKARYDVISQKVIPSEVGLVELLLNVMGDGSISIGVALQHPLSQGRVYINSSSIFDPPLIQPNYLAHPADVVMLREGLKVARRLGSTAPFNTTLLNETSPGLNVQSDADWDSWIAGSTWTQFHPACTSAMLSQNQGGVVDTSLKVHGTNNLRVIDGSVFPFLFATHLGAPTYGVAEIGSTLVARNSASSSLPKGSWSWLDLFHGLPTSKGQ